MFGEVPHLSDYYVPETLIICDKGAVKGESCICTTSFEDMVEFVTDRVGSHAKAWSTENVHGSFQNVTIEAVHLVHGNLSEPVAICHTTPFYFQIYYCHVFPKVKLYAVDEHDAAGGRGKKKNNIVMACHFDTSEWNPRHLAFKLMGFGPGKVEICHWLVEDDIVFAKV